jgi:hypothetical protein
LRNSAERGKKEIVEYLYENTKVSLKCNEEVECFPNLVVTQSSFVGKRYFGEERLIYKSWNDFKSDDYIFKDFILFWHDWSGNADTLVEETLNFPKERFIFHDKYYRENTYFYMIRHSMDRDRVEVLQFCANIYRQNNQSNIVHYEFSDLFPRLDLIVMYWQIGAFKWLLSCGFIDLEENTTLINDENTSIAEEDEYHDNINEQCSICYKEKLLSQVIVSRIGL